MRKFEAAQTQNNGQAKFTIVEEDGSRRVYYLNAGEARNLVRAAIRCLAQTKIDRDYGQWWATKDREVEHAVEPVMKLVAALFPKPRSKAAS